MAPAVASLATAIRSTADVQHIFHHVFLPPKLPQAQDDPETTTRFELGLLEATRLALRSFRDYYPDDKPLINSAIGGIQTALRTLTDRESALDQDAILDALRDVTTGKQKAVPLFIRAQNAGVLITKDDRGLIFEAFELSPINSAVNGTKGRLVRHFPGSAVHVADAECSQPAFQAVIAHTLSRMSTQAVPGMQPKSQKAGALHDEVRDTTHPGVITELLLNVLKGSGAPHAAATVTKHTRDEVLWTDTEIPWRRSPLWMLVRVFLQLTFSRTEVQHGHELYKTFIAFFSACLLNRADELYASPITLFAMSAKITRRVHKLGAEIPQKLKNSITIVLRRVGDALTRDWDSIQRQLEVHLDLEHLLSGLDLIQDSVFSVHGLREYVEASHMRRTANIHSRPELTPGFFHYSDDSIPKAKFLSSAGSYTLAALLRFESWVPAHLDKCLGNYPVDDACRSVHQLLTEYHEVASKAYVGNAEGVSVMVLTIFELWMACDKCAVGHHPTLGEYDINLPLSCLQSLILPTRHQMTRLRAVELYCASRQKGVCHDAGQLFGDPISPNPRKHFAVRYFNHGPDSGEMQGYMNRIQQRCHELKEEKVQELRSKKAEHNDLQRKAAKLDCVYKARVLDAAGQVNRDRVHDDDLCLKCPLLAKAKAIKIEVFEELLPHNEDEAKAVVFELRIPGWFSSWRDCTIVIISDVLKAGCDRSYNGQPNKRFTLPEDRILQKWYKRCSRRVTLGSVKKRQSHTHWKEKEVTDSIPENEVCVANGLEYHYVDGTRMQFLGGFTATDVVAQQCTYRLPERSRDLRKFIANAAARPHREAPNSVIASLSERPEFLKFDEYTELCTLPQGFQTQWYDLALQLHAGSVDFSKEETGLFVLQCIHQSGPAADIGTDRIAHEAITKTSSLAHRILQDLQASLEKIGDNWESANALAIFASIASRLLTLTSSIETQNACKSFLAATCDMAFKWVDDLRHRSHTAPDPQDRKDARVRAMQAALVCIACYDVDDRHLAETLQKQHQVARFVQCSIVLGQRAYKKPNPLVEILLVRFRRVLQRSRSYIAPSSAGIDEAIMEMWPQYDPGQQDWTQLPGNSAHWLTKNTTTLAGHQLTLHYDVLSGTFLVNGTKLSQPPAHYQKASLYKVLFKDLDVEVMPSHLSGMSYMISRLWDGFEVHLGWSTGSEELQVVAFKNGFCYETIPSGVLQGHFPKSFVSDYVHWLNRSSFTIDFRPAADSWNLSSPEIWQLSVYGHEGAWTLEKASVRLLGVNTASSLVLSRILSSLVDSTQIHVYLLDPMRGDAEIDLPDLQIGFRLLMGSTNLRSREFPDMLVDENQTMLTLFGLVNKLLLKPRTAGKRRVLVPEGPVSYEPHRAHMSVTVDKSAIRKVHALVVNERIGCLEDNGSLQCKLYLAYLHALTSFFLPDPLTAKTGTEQALSILNSAAIRSLIQQLTPNNTDMLSKIADLSPGRSYYPSKNNKPMQSVTWDDKLQFMSQHGSFFEVAQSMMQQSADASMFFPEARPRFPPIDHSDEWLLERDLIRSSTFRIWDYGAERFNKEHDAIYRARDAEQGSDRASRAFIVSRMVFMGEGMPHWPAAPAGYLTNLAKNLPLVHGPTSSLEEATMKYDASLFQTSAASLVQQLPMLHANIAANHISVDHFTLAMWLSTIAFSGGSDMYMVQLIALCSALEPFRGIRLPQVPSFDPSAGCPGKTVFGLQDKLAVAVRDAARSFERTPAADRNTTEGERRRIYDMKVANAARHFVKQSADWWRSKKIKPPRLGDHEPYLRESKALKIVEAQFKVYEDNEALNKYLDQLQVAVAGLLPKQQELDLRPLKTPAYISNARSGVVSVADMFSGPAPLLAAPPPDINVEEGEEQALTFTMAGAQLGKLVKDMYSGASTYQKQYLDRLQKSRNSLFVTGEVFRHVASQDVVWNFLHDCNAYTRATLDTIHAAVLSGLEHDIATPLHLPRFSPTLLLKQLNRHNWPHMNAAWKECVVRYALALAAEQRAERLFKAHCSDNKEDFAKELDNIGHTNWDPSEFPESLLIEVESGLMIREVQEQVARPMRSPPNGLNSMMQLNMGEGKSSVIVPMVAAALADGKQLVRVIVAKPQSKQMAQMLIAKLGGLLDRRIFYMPFSRAVKLSPQRAQAVQDLCRKCMEVGGIMLVQPEHILSFQLMGPECLVSGRDNAHPTGRVVLQTQDFLDKVSRDIVDESDENFAVNFELIYTMGLHSPIELKPERWNLIQEVLGLIRDHVAEIASDDLKSFEITEGASVAGFPRLRILNGQAGQALYNRVVHHICQQGLHSFPAARNIAARRAIHSFISKYDVPEQDLQAVQSGDHWAQYHKTLLLLRGLFACRLLSFAFEQKRWRVNYGLAERSPPTRLAVPYRAKDMPSLRAEFSHPDVVIVFTCLSYYYGGLEDEHLFLTLGHLVNSDQKDVEYQSWIKDIDMPEAFRDLSGVNLKDGPACVSQLFPHLRFAKGVIDYFLSHIVFEKGMREFEFKMSASGWDIGKVKGRPTTGFSGTNDIRDLYPLDVHQNDLKEQLHTNALVLDRLLQPENKVALMRQASSAAVKSDAERLLDEVLHLEPMPQVILDVGAQILELTNQDFAKLWLKREVRGNKEAAIFCNENDELTVVDMRGNLEPLQTSSFATRMDACLVYLDEAHTRGIDLKLPIHYRAAVTLGADLTKDRLVQACMRMRQLGKGQTVVFCVSEEIQAKIMSARIGTDNQVSIPECAGLPTHLEVSDVLGWAIRGTFDSVERSIPLWVTQGHRFALQQDIWDKIGSGNKAALTPDQAQEFREPEARTIEFRYSPGREFDDQLQKLTDSKHLATYSEATRKKLMLIQKRSRSFGSPSQGARRLLEEQERELSPEKEETRHDEVAPPAIAATHSLHPDLIKWVKEGRKPADSNALVFAFDTLKDTSSGKNFNVGQFGHLLNDKERLLATKDFATTVKAVPDCEHTSDAFLRPVQWILTVRQPKDNVVGTAILISPFEARRLMKYVQESQFAALHLYKPRTNVRHAPLDKLDFCMIRQGSGNLKISAGLITQLNVFAGQLYFSSYSEYTDICNFLGLVHYDAVPADWDVAPDRYIRRDGNGRAGGLSGLSQSPVEFLKVFYGKIRRHGEDISKTHMGRLLGGQLLSAKDFAVK